eukprot:GEMP01071089.1.p2 GENE.GEMP01071089.1~~GEMP01071089.1.p2  ORF type:complete len:132 (+),score=23.44 GEMP01071089.1:217-612(+)
MAQGRAHVITYWDQLSVVEAFHGAWAEMEPKLPASAHRNNLEKHASDIMKKVIEEELKKDSKKLTLRGDLSNFNIVDKNVKMVIKDLVIEMNPGEIRLWGKLPWVRISTPEIVQGAVPAARVKNRSNIISV